jgi:hypothetical protein
MDYYKIYKDQWSLVKQFANLEDAQAFADTLGVGYTAEFYKAYTPPTIQQRLDMDMDFGSHIIYIFVEDNRVMDITPEQSEAVLVKFRDILAFAQTGAITSIQNYLPLIPTDDVFTQERKDKYITMINEYLAQFN